MNPMSYLFKVPSFRLPMKSGPGTLRFLVLFLLLIGPFSAYGGIPAGFNQVKSAKGVVLYKKDYSGGQPDYVMVVDLGVAKIVQRTGSISDPGTGKGPLGGNNPTFWRKSLETFWSEVSSSEPNAFGCVNGQFFSSTSDPTGVAFSIKDGGTVISDGYGITNEYQGKIKLFRYDNDNNRASIVDFSTAALNSPTYKSAVAALAETANKSPNTYTGRTFIGIDDKDGDGKAETVLIFVSSYSKQADAANVLYGFGADSVAMLDGGGSSQLIVKGTGYVNSTRKIPHSICVVAGTGVPPDSSDFPWYSQNDPAWKNQQLGTCKSETIGSAGCAVACVAMLLTREAGQPGSPTPATLNTWLKNNAGYSQGCLINWDTAANYDGSGGLVWEERDNSWNDWTWFDSQLAAGHMVIAKVDWNPASTKIDTHFVVITHRNGPSGVPGSYFINDPWPVTRTPRTLAYYYDSVHDNTTFGGRAYSGTLNHDCPTSDGSLIKKTDSAAVYYMLRGRRWWVMNEAIFNALGLDFADVCVMSDSKVNAIPNGPNIGGENTLFKCPECGAAVYEINSGKRWGFKFDWVFSDCYGYSFDDVFDRATPGFQALYPTGGDLDAECKPGSHGYKDCGNCGSRTRTCNSSCKWEGWGSCTGEGICSPNTTRAQACGNCGSHSRTCNSSCKWEGWGVCSNQGECSPNETGPCNECGRMVCDNMCKWGSCIGNDNSLCNDSKCCTEDSCGPGGNCLHQQVRCKAGWFCVESDCMCHEGCAGVKTGGECKGDVLYWCANGLLKQEDCAGQGKVCINDDPAYCCTPDCKDKECGSDGCGKQCGLCPDGTLCAWGQCLVIADETGEDVQDNQDVPDVQVVDEFPDAQMDEETHDVSDAQEGQVTDTTHEIQPDVHLIKDTGPVHDSYQPDINLIKDMGFVHETRSDAHLIKDAGFVHDSYQPDINLIKDMDVTVIKQDGAGKNSGGCSTTGEPSSRSLVMVILVILFLVLFRRPKTG